jgi:ankyrin repeat protein
MTTLLLAHGADVNSADDAGWTPLHWAATIDFKNVQLVEMLVARGANVNAKAKDGSTPLAQAVQNGDIAKFLIAHGGHL